MAGPQNPAIESHVPHSLVSQHLNIPEEVLATFPRNAQGITPLQ